MSGSRSAIQTTLLSFPGFPKTCVDSPVRLSFSTGWATILEPANRAIQLERGTTPQPTTAEPGSFARVTRVVRMIENDPDEGPDLDGLARMAPLSPYHFLRTFEGLTRHRGEMRIRRTRLKGPSPLC